MLLGCNYIAFGNQLQCFCWGIAILKQIKGKECLQQGVCIAVQVEQHSSIRAILLNRNIGARAIERRSYE